MAEKDDRGPLIEKEDSCGSFEDLEEEFQRLRTGACPCGNNRLNEFTVREHESRDLFDIECNTCHYLLQFSGSESAGSKKQHILVSDIVDLKPGDHIFWCRARCLAIFEHHAIVGGKIDENKISVFHCIKGGSESVTKEQVLLFNGNKDPVYRVSYDIPADPRIVLYRANEIFLEARGLVPRERYCCCWSYNVCRKNCEHFARLCFTGRKTCYQWTREVILLITVTLCLLETFMMGNAELTCKEKDGRYQCHYKYADFAIAYLLYLTKDKLINLAVVVGIEVLFLFFGFWVQRVQGHKAKEIVKFSVWLLIELSVRLSVILAIGIFLPDTKFINSDAFTHSKVSFWGLAILFKITLVFMLIFFTFLVRFIKRKYMQHKQSRARIVRVRKDAHAPRARHF